MNNTSTVQELESTKNLVQKHLDVVAGKRLRRDDYPVQVSLHQFRQYVSASRSMQSKKHRKSDTLGEARRRLFWAVTNSGPSRSQTDESEPVRIRASMRERREEQHSESRRCKAACRQSANANASQR